MTVALNLTTTPIKYMVKTVEQADDGTSTTFTFKDGTPVRAKDILLARKRYNYNFQTHYQEFDPEGQNRSGKRKRKKITNSK